MLAKSPESFRTITLAQIARELGLSTTRAKQRLSTLGFTGIVAKRRHGKAILYNAKALEVIKGLYRMPHRSVSDTQDDWLTDYITAPTNKGELK